ncbi:MAG: dynamin family protein [Alphaproteobacteria bacterium]|nr:dynamin family protein [Alphaproteobacteria bacterium]
MTSTEPYAQQLRGEVARALEGVEGLLAHEALLGPETAQVLRDTCDSVRQRLGREAVAVAVVGEKKAGKSTLLNAILGEALLGAAVRECTGTVILLQRGEARDYVARFADGRVERFSEVCPDPVAPLEAELERLSHEDDATSATFREALQAELAEERLDHRARFAARVAALTDRDVLGREVHALHLTLPAARLPEGFVLVDTPGVNTDDTESRDRAWRAIHEHADGCLLICDLQQPLSQSTLAFLDALRPVVPHVVLILTKLDRVMEDAAEVGGDPQEEAEEARRVAVRRFARQVGRDADDVLALAVAARPALEAADPQSVAAFDEDMRQMFHVLRQERELVLASRAATALALGVEGIQAGAREAERRGAALLAQLEAQAIPTPGRFCDDWLEATRPRIRRRAGAIVAELLRALPGVMLEVDAGVSAIIESAKDRAALVALSKDLRAVVEAELDAGLAQLRRSTRAALNEATRSLLPHALEGLRQRYALLEALRFTPWSLADAPPALERLSQEISLGIDPERLLVETQSEQVEWGVRGAAAGAAIGFFLTGGAALPVLLALGAGGAAAARYGPLGTLRRRTQAAAQEALRDAETRLSGQLRGSGPALTLALEDALGDALAQATARFSDRIEALLQAERTRIDAQRAQLESLVAAAAQLQPQAEHLRASVAALRGASRALCAGQGPSGGDIL